MDPDAYYEEMIRRDMEVDAAREKYARQDLVVGLTLDLCRILAYTLHVISNLPSNVLFPDHQEGHSQPCSGDWRRSGTATTGSFQTCHEI